MSNSSATPVFEHSVLRDNLVSLTSFHAIIWTAVTICTLLSAIRLYIRLKCFHRLLLDDWMLIFAWTMLISTSSLGQVYLKDVYVLMAISEGAMAPDADFPVVAQHALRAFGVMIILSYLGIWAIKLGFLLFFKRLGYQVKAFTIFWWVVLVFTIACGVVELVLTQYRCIFGPLDYVMTVCPQFSRLQQTYDYFKGSCILDVVSDVCIVIFPVVILWNVRVNLRTKIILCGIFSLVLFTIAITIVRGSIFGGVYRSIKQMDHLEMNMTWIWFWFFIEQSVSLIIASLTSFRALFTRKTNTHDRQDNSPLGQSPESPSTPTPGNDRGLRLRARWLHDSVLQSFKTTETIDDMGPPYPSEMLNKFSSSSISDVEHGQMKHNKNPSIVTSST